MWRTCCSPNLWLHHSRGYRCSPGAIARLMIYLLHLSSFERRSCRRAWHDAFWPIRKAPGSSSWSAVPWLHLGSCLVNFHFVAFTLLESVPISSLPSMWIRLRDRAQCLRPCRPTFHRYLTSSPSKLVLFLLSLVVCCFLYFCSEGSFVGGVVWANFPTRLASDLKRLSNFY